ncbi:MAG TPA: hypothetical protein VFO05_09270 [Candidatus Limnocylindrales bacterium]|nr:hypothetical protein [Candidatus Limnocylindrales bacterium]
MTPRASPSAPLVGAFQFAEAVSAMSDADVRQLADWGVDTLVTEGDTYDPDAIHRIRDAGLRFFAGLSGFSDHAHGNAVLSVRPELHPIDETGRPRPQLEWYVGVTPTVADYRESRAQAAERIARDHDIDGLMLDFVRWPLHWELELRPGQPRPAMSSFDPATLADFSQSTGVQLPGELRDPASCARWILREASDAWTAYRCAVITSFVEDVAGRVRAIRPDIAIGVFVVPLPPEALAEAVGQDVRALSQAVDLLAPKTYHAILHRDPTWVRATTDAIAASADCSVVPVVQVDSADGPALGADWGPPVSPEEWAAVAHTAWDAGSGLVAFPAGALARDGRGRTLADVAGRAR